MSREFTVYQATNPATAPEVLAAMASSRADLRQFVAANPATPQEVVQWLAGLGDHAVDAALVRRRPAAPSAPLGDGPAPPLPGTGSGLPPTGPAPPAGQPPPPAGPPPSMPPTPPPEQPGPAAGPWASPAGGPYGPGSSAPGPAPTQPGTAPGNPYAAPGPAPYPPAGDPYAAPGGPVPGSPYGGPGSGSPYGGPAPAAGHPMDAYGYQLPEPGRRTGLIVAIAVGSVLVLGALVFAASTIFGSLTGGGSSYGEDAEMDQLWDDCADGDGEACDDLYRQSPLGSEYEEFGDTCGGRYPPQHVWCAEVM